MDIQLEKLYNNYIKTIVETEKPENAGGYSFVWGFGNEQADVVLVGEAPGKDEVANGKPFVGKAGGILDTFLNKTGIRRERLFITNTIKYRLARPKKGLKEDLRLTLDDTFPQT